MGRPRTTRDHCPPNPLPLPISGFPTPTHPSLVLEGGSDLLERARGSPGVSTPSSAERSASRSLGVLSLRARGAGERKMISADKFKIAPGGARVALSRPLDLGS